jgi:hypothetical protein
MKRTCERTHYPFIPFIIPFTNNNCKRDKVDNVATRKLIEVIGNDVQKYERWKLELLNEFYSHRAHNKTRKVFANLTSSRVYTHSTLLFALRQKTRPAFYRQTQTNHKIVSLLLRISIQTERKFGNERSK